MLLPELPAVIGGKYRPLGVIGVGSMGVVYSVEHTVTGEHLALKVMTSHHGASREAIERFKREARASAKIKSEHVVRVIDADVAPELDRAPYLVMDLLEGTDLEKASADQPIAAPMVIEWLRQVGRVLDKAHRLGITHRDLKPENLFLTHRENGTPLIKILDFGIAKIAAESTGTTQSGQILGTPLYMSPEQARGDPLMIGPPADLYALGLIAYKLLTGAPYWNATSVAGIIGQVLYEPMTAPSARGCTFGAEFDQWFLRACHREAAHRFGTAVEQVEALAKALGVPPDTRSDSLKSNPGASGDALVAPPNPGGSGGLRPETATIAQSGGTLVSSSSETSHGKALPSRRRRTRAVFYGVMSAAALSSVLVMLFHRKEPAPPAAVLVKPAALADESVSLNAVSLPLQPPVIPPPLLEPPAPPSKAAPPVASAAAGNSGRRKESIKAAPARSAAGGATRSEKSFANDPLGDQK